LDKLKELKKLISDSGSSAKIEVDGGVTLENAKSIVEAGADALVAGNTVFSSASPAQTISMLKKI
jgi:ribulose-phosphate 3-epimerase